MSDDHPRRVDIDYDGGNGTRIRLSVSGRTLEDVEATLDRQWAKLTERIESIDSNTAALRADAEALEKNASALADNTQALREPCLTRGDVEQGQA